MRRSSRQARAAAYVEFPELRNPHRRLELGSDSNALPAEQPFESFPRNVSNIVEGAQEDRPARVQVSPSL